VLSWLGLRLPDRVPWRAGIFPNVYHKAEIALLAIYSVELLYNQLPSLAGEALRQELEQLGHTVDKIRPGRAPGSFVFSFPAPLLDVAHQAAQSPLMVIVVRDEPLPYDELRPALQQAAEWPQANTVVAPHTAVVQISDFHAEGLDARTRLAFMHDVVSALLALAPPIAIHWQPSQRLIPPDRYRAERRGGHDPIFPAVHLRHFTVEDPLVDETVTDTLGLTALGLPDLQCHYTGLTRETVATVLQRVAYVLFAQGNVLGEGDTVAGLTPEQPWRCRRQLSLIPPVREIIDLDPGAPYAPNQS
jgi:hypothetical protein